jgi:ornithine cyclodeaminase
VAVLVLDAAAVRRNLPMTECIAAMERALRGLARGELELELRTHVEGDEGSLLLMPSRRVAGDYAVKLVTVYPENPRRGQPAIQGAVLLLDGSTGSLRALLDAAAVTAIRTAAVSALATRLLAREDARSLAILGAGVQARSHLEAVASVRALESARVWSPRSATALAAETTGRFGFPVEAATSARAAVEGADVVVTVTSSTSAVLERAWLAPGAHVNAVGAHLPTARELDTATVADGTVYVDSREAALAEAGDLLIPIGEGAIGPEHIRAELGDLVASGAPARAPTELSVFKSLGLAVEDLAAAEVAVQRAEAAGDGTLVEL